MDWRGRTVVCIASGPSLTADDCEAVRASGLPAVVTNDTYRLCPWADALIGYDSRWWWHKTAAGVRHELVARDFRGERFTMAASGAKLGVAVLRDRDGFPSAGNSGTTAIYLAISEGAARIVLLGFDCQKTAGRSHWHGDHPAGLSNAASLKSWPGLFASVAHRAKSAGVEVVNCSRDTALTCFPRAALAEELARVQSGNAFA